MNGCLLYLPFFAYGAEQTKILDISGQGNHGIITGSIPSTPPMLSPIEKVTDGGFSGDGSAWTQGTGWSIGSGVATKVAGVASDLEQDISAVAGETYQLSYVLTRTAGTLTPQIGGVNGTARSASGGHRDIITATGTGNLKFQAGSTFAGTIDVVSVKKITGYEGSSWFFDGVDDVVTVTSNATLIPGTGDFTAAIWFKTWSAAIVAHGLFGKYTGAGGGMGWEIYHYGITNCQCYLANGIQSHTFNLGNVADNKWHFVCLRHDYDVGTYGDIDGNLNYASDVTPTLSAGLTNTTNMEVGSVVAEGVFKGYIGECFYFNRFLSPEESLSLFELTRAKYGV